MSKYVEEAKKLGYEVELAFETGDGVKAWSIKGWGMETTYPEDDEQMWKWIVNKDAHEHRVNMAKHNDPEDEFIMNDNEILDSSLKASVSAGLITKEDAERMKEQRAVVASQ